MAPRLVTPRLVLRPAEIGDVPAFEAHWNDPEVRRYLWDDESVPRSLVEAVVRRSGETFAAEGYGLWSIAIAAEPRPVGVCGLRAVEGTAHVEVVYSLDPRHWGRGLATEAARAVLGYGFSTLGLERIVGGADEGNVASLRVLRRLGMDFHDHLTVDGHVVPYYAVDRDRFAALHGGVVLYEGYGPPEPPRNDSRSARVGRRRA